MTAYTNLRARYSKGMLKLAQHLNLPENAEVQVTVTTLGNPKVSVKSAFTAVPPGVLSKIDGIIALGGDAVADGDALYDSD